MSATHTTCPNCSSALQQKDRYCAQCSQATHLHRFSLPHIGHELFHAFTHADKGVLYLLKELTVRPGVVARGYILEGKRKKYFNPFTFLLLVLGFAVFVNSYFEPYGKSQSPTNQPKLNGQTPAKPIDPAIIQRRDAVYTVLNKKANIIAFVALPLFTLVFWLFFLRTGINYAEHLVANIFFAGYFQLFASLLTVILGLFGIRTSTISEQQLFFQFFYLPIAYYQFINYQKPVKFLLALLASVLALGVWILFSSQAIRLYITYGL